MKIWFPTIRAGSGSDVYVERLVAALRERGVNACLQWFDHRCEFVPHLLQGVTPPAGTNLIHAISSWSAFTFSKTDTPLVVSALHCVYRNGYPEWKTLAQALYHNYWIGHLEQRSFTAAHAVVAMTPSALNDFKQQFTLPSPQVIHGWVDTDLFKPSATSRTKTAISRILIVGNTSKRKGIDLLPKFVEELGDLFTVTVVGGLRQKYEGKCKGVRYRHSLSVQELVNEYQQTDIVVSLSRYEGFGYSVLEAMACGKPVVAFNTVGICDLIEDGYSGHLAKLNDTNELAALCKKLRTNPAQASKLGEYGRTRSLMRFDQASAINAYLALYEDLIKTPRSLSL